MIGNISYRCMLLKRYILFVVKQTNNLQWGWPDLKKNKVHCAFAFCPNWYEILTLCLQFQIDSSSGLYADFRTSSFHRTWFGLSPSSYVIIMMHKYHDACRFHIICRCNVGYIKVCNTWNSWRHRKHNRFWQAIRQKIIPGQSDHQAPLHIFYLCAVLAFTVEPLLRPVLALRASVWGGSSAKVLSSSFCRGVGVAAVGAVGVGVGVVLLRGWGWWLVVFGFWVGGVVQKRHWRIVKVLC